MSQLVHKSMVAAMDPIYGGSGSRKERKVEGYGTRQGAVSRGRL